MVANSLIWALSYAAAYEMLALTLLVAVVIIVIGVIMCWVSNRR